MSGVAMLTAQFEDGPIRQHLARLALLHAGGYRRARIEIGEYFVGEVQDNLSRQQLVNGAAMPQSKAAIERSGKTLIDKGHLRDSYVYQLTGEGVEIGSAKIYAAIHHFGGATGRGHKTILPARPVLGLTADGEAEIGSIMIDEIRRAQA
jgi:phage virion morphogenesis protein